MTEQPTEYVVPKDQGQIDALLDALDMPPCQRCGAIVETRATALCWPCRQGNARSMWGVTVRPRAAVFDWEGQAQLYASDLATLNARDVRRAGLLNAARAHVPKELREQIDLELERR